MINQELQKLAENEVESIREPKIPPLPENVETASGKDLDPLLSPPSQITVVQALKGKIDLFLQRVTNYEGSKKQLQAVMVALAIHPFGEGSPKFGYPAADELYDLGVQILTDKLLFLHLGIKEQEIAREIREKTETKKEEEIV